MEARNSSDRRWRSGEWRAVAGGLSMLTALAVVWALVATLTLLQRNRDLAKATQDLNDLREHLVRLERDPIPTAEEPARDHYYFVDDAIIENEPDVVDELEDQLRELIGDHF